MLAPNRYSVTLVADNLILALEKKVSDLIELSRELNRENRASDISTQPCILKIRSERYIHW